MVKLVKDRGGDEGVGEVGGGREGVFLGGKRR